MTDVTSQSQAAARFATAGPSWEERSTCGELSAVINPSQGDYGRGNRFLHGVETFAAGKAAGLCPAGGTVLDFGCGTGRFLRYFASRGLSVIGTEITEGMLSETRRFGLPAGSQVHLTDGVHVPLPDASVDLIWVCGVLKYSLLPPGAPSRGWRIDEPLDPETLAKADAFVPVYADVAREMYRVLKPGRCVVNVEMCVNVPAERFLPDFTAAGFRNRRVRVLQKYDGWLEQKGQSPRVPVRFVDLAGRLTAAYRCWFADPDKQTPGFRDYLFVWVKPQEQPKS